MTDISQKAYASKINSILEANVEKYINSLPQSTMLYTPTLVQTPSYKTSQGLKRDTSRIVRPQAELELKGAGSPAGQKFVLTSGALPYDYPSNLSVDPVKKSTSIAQRFYGEPSKLNNPFAYGNMNPRLVGGNCYEDDEMTGGKRRNAFKQLTHQLGRSIKSIAIETGKKARPLAEKVINKGLEKGTDYALDYLENMGKEPSIGAGRRKKGGAILLAKTPLGYDTEYNKFMGGQILEEHYAKGGSLKRMGKVHIPRGSVMDDEYVGSEIGHMGNMINNKGRMQQRPVLLQPPPFKGRRVQNILPYPAKNDTSFSGAGFVEPPMTAYSQGQPVYGAGRKQLPHSGRKRESARGAIVAEVMKKHGLSLAQASSYVKQHGLY
jgi:hypothetical protein